MFVATAISGDDILTALWSFLLTLDGLVYNLICYVTNIFDALIKLNLFSNSGYTDLVKRFYVVLGLIMLFALAYSLLKAIINPENFSKGETSFSKLIGNTVSSLIIIAILPTVFSVAFNIQNSLVNQGTIYNLIIGNNTENNTKDITMNNSGRYLAYYTFRSFLLENPDSELCSSYDDDPSECDELIKSEATGETLKDTNSSVLYNNGSFTLYNGFAKSVVVDKSLIHYFPISFLAGLFMLYVLLNFCFDVAVRVVKLAFYQIIAPIPVMCRIVPGGKMKDVFSKWLKQVISLFVEVFIRMAALAFGVFFLKIILHDGSDYSITDQLRNIGLKFFSRTFVKALLIMAIVVFIRQIPKIIGDMFGLDTGGMKLGLTEKLAMGGGFVAANTVGSLVASHGNPLAAYRGFKYGLKNKDLRNIGHESNYRAAKAEAKAQGASEFDILTDRFRRSLGFETKFERKSREADAEIELLNAEVNTSKEPIDGLQRQLNGNQKGMELSKLIKDKGESEVLKEDSEYYVPEFVYTTSSGETIDFSGLNLYSIQDALNSDRYDNILTEQDRQVLRARFKAAKKDMTRTYVNDCANGNEDRAGGTDSEMKGWIRDYASNGVTNEITDLTDDQLQVLSHGGPNYYDVICDLKDDLEEKNRDISRQIQDINQSNIGKLQQIEELKRNKEKSEFVKYKASSDVASKPVGEIKPHGFGGRHFRGPGGGPGPGPGPGGPDDFGPGPGPGGPGPGGMP